MTARAWAEAYRTTTVCVDSYEAGVFSGYFSNPYLDGPRSFRSLSQFLLEMEDALDQMDFPKAYHTVRTFQAPAGTPRSVPELDCQTGRAATFAVRILFRQNASWQGSIVWLEGKQEQSFRSALELIFLMNNALTQSKAS